MAFALKQQVGMRPLHIRSFQLFSHVSPLGGVERSLLLDIVCRSRGRAQRDQVMLPQYERVGPAGGSPQPDLPPSVQASIGQRGEQRGHGADKAVDTEGEDVP